jgi:hypothetical protein
MRRKEEGRRSCCNERHSRSEHRLVECSRILFLAGAGSTNQGFEVMPPVSPARLAGQGFGPLWQACDLVRPPKGERSACWITRVKEALAIGTGTCWAALQAISKTRGRCNGPCTSIRPYKVLVSVSEKPPFGTPGRGRLSPGAENGMER